MNSSCLPEIAKREASFPRSLIRFSALLSCLIKVALVGSLRALHLGKQLVLWIGRHSPEPIQASPRLRLISRAVNPFPSIKARRLLAVLERQPLGYRIVRQSGSHRRLESADFPPLTFSFHDKATVPSGLVRKILVRDVGLDEEQARKLL